MSKILEQFRELTPNIELCKKLIITHQKEYLRKRLRLIELLWEGKTETEAYKKVRLCRETANKCLHVIVDNGVEKGLKILSEQKEVKRDFKLSEDQSKEIILMLETQTPRDYEYDKSIFTGEIIAEIIEKKYGIKVSTSLVYDLLHRHDFSYHKAHRDYIEADKEKQSAYQETLKKTWKTRKMMK
jgi:transposase